MLRNEKDSERRTSVPQVSRRVFLGGGVKAAASILLAGHGSLVLASGTGKGSSPRFDALAERIAGKVLVPQPSQYDELHSSMVWNVITPSRMPDVIVRAAGEKDVVEAIKFARKNKLKVSIRGGGHNFYGLPFRKGGMLIDLSSLNEVSINPQEMTASVQPIITNAEFAKQLAASDLAFPVGHCPDVAMSGYLLNGGFPFNAAQWGPACDSVEALDMVTADGRIVKASPHVNSDLFWAARGAGPDFFAVVTRFHLKLHRLPKAMMESTYFCDYADIKEVASEVARIAEHSPENMELTIALATAPPFLADKCSKYRGRACIFSACSFAHTEQEALAALAPYESSPVLARCLAKTVNKPSSFDALFEFHKKIFPERHRYQVEIMCSNNHPADILAAASDTVLTSPSAKSMVGCVISPAKKQFLQPQSNRAFSMSGNVVGGCWAIWDSTDDGANLGWHASVIKQFQPFTNQHYIGETDVVTNPDFARGAFKAEQWNKLQALRLKYDPDGLFFRLNEGLA